MEQAMVTGRMSLDKKERGSAVLRESGMNASQAINRMFDRLCHDGNADFLEDAVASSEQTSWESAARFVDQLSAPISGRFDGLSKAEIRTERLRARGLM